MPPSPQPPVTQCLFFNFSFLFCNYPASLVAAAASSGCNDWSVCCKIDDEEKKKKKGSEGKGREGGSLSLAAATITWPHLPQTVDRKWAPSATSIHCLLLLAIVGPAAPPLLPSLHSTQTTYLAPSLFFVSGCCCCHLRSCRVATRSANAAAAIVGNLSRSPFSSAPEMSKSRPDYAC